jgi:aryl-phospho-beta-D-glucosidase BglC (GH1 family)
VVQLRGINLGNWLLIEPWMTGLEFGVYTGEDNRQDEFAGAVTDIVGKEKATVFFETWRDNYITYPDIKYIKSLGFNSVRVPLDYRLFYDKETGKDIETGFGCLDRLLIWCAREKIYVLPDMHSVPGGKLISNSGSIFADAKKQDILAHIWRRIARRYAHNPWIGGWDLINEPGRWDEKHLELGLLYKKITEAIRGVDKNHLIIVEGDHWASRLDLIGIGGDTAPLWDNNIAYSDHDYGGSLSEQPISKTKKYDNPYSLPAHRLLTQRLDIPLWLGEFGYNSNPWIRSVIKNCKSPAALRQDGITADTPVGWCMWAYKARAIWTPVCIHAPSSLMLLTDYWQKRKTNPNLKTPAQKPAFDALMELARSANFNSCAVNKDVTDMLTRTDFETKTKPFNTNLSIPGQIKAVDYDMGNEGIAYHDRISTDEAGKGPAGRAWNSGWNYRNDGVDIYPENDNGPSYVVGEIEEGEWLDFTIRCKPGRYNLLIRYSSPNGAGRMHIDIDGVNISGQIDLPKTGDWHTYSTIAMPVKVTSLGLSKMKLFFDTGGFNANWIEYNKISHR